MWNTEIQEIKGDKQVKSVTLIDNTTKKTSELAVDAVFVQVGEAPNSQIAKAAGIETDEHGYIKVDIRPTNKSARCFCGRRRYRPTDQASWDSCGSRNHCST